jgi:hypothetical protein
VNSGDCYFVSVVRMLNRGALSLRSLTAASVRMSVVPGVMSARTWLRNSGAIISLLARPGRFGAPADARSSNPVASSIRIHRIQRGVDVRPRKPLDAANRCAPDLHAVMMADWRRSMVARFKTGKHLKLSLC